MPGILRVLLGLTLLLGAGSTSTSAQRTVNPQTARRPGPPLATPPQGSSYCELPIISKVLYFVNNNHVRPWQRPWTAFESTVKAVAHEVPGMSVDCQESRLTAHLGTQDWQAQAGEVDTPWTMRTKLQQLFAWIAPHLAPREGLSTEQRLARLEVSASNGLLSAIDAHSVLLSPAQSREYVVQKPHLHASIGLVLRQLDGRPCVESAVANGPAARAGIPAGSILEKLDGESVTGMSLEQIVARLRGLVGTSVHLTLNHGPHSDPVSLSVVREQVAPPSVVSPAQMFLKLTTAHFLAPRDQVIEGVGITPDIVLCADRGAPTTCKATGRAPLVRYLVASPAQGSCGELLVAPEDEFPVQLARDLLVRARGTSARQMLIDGQSLLQAAPKTGENKRPKVRKK